LFLEDSAMKCSRSLFSIAVVLGASVLMVAVGSNRSELNPFLIVGHRYKCVTDGEDFDITVREVIDHQWIRAETQGMTIRTTDGDRPFPMLINLSRVNAIVPVDLKEANANLAPTTD
jgi:hypothetical protein